MDKIVAYYRVSTEEQGRSGLGLEAQRSAVAALCESRGWAIVAEFTDVESGKRSDRPQLLAALQQADLTGATVCVAKLDRLSRDANYISNLQVRGAKFVAANMPEATGLLIHIMAGIAQEEREAISQRTKAALAVAKAKGMKLGNPNGAAALHKAGKGNVAAVAVLKAEASIHAAKVAPVVARLRAAGVTSLPRLALSLNNEGIRTPRGGRWHPSSVSNLLKRIDGGQPLGL